MDTQEWSLILFSVLAQMSVGAFLVLGVVHFLAKRKAGPEEADRMSDRALLAIGPALVLGMLASFAHLGNPINAPRAVTNLAHSWLSREIFFFTLFTLVGGVFAVMQWRKIGTPTVRNVIAWVTALIGVILVYSMAQVYRLSNQPAWDTIATELQFFATTFLLGSLAVGAAFAANYAYLKRSDKQHVQLNLLRASLQWVAVTAVIFLGVQMVVSPLLVASLAAAGDAASVNSAALMFNQYGVVYGLRLALLFIGAGVIGLFLHRYASAEGKESLLGTLVFSAFALALISELLGRYLFYTAHVGVGL